MQDNYVIYKGVRMTEQEAEARINDAYCDAADKARIQGGTAHSSDKKATAAPKTAKSK